MKKDYIISLVIHGAVFSVIIAFSVGSGKAQVPQVGEFVSVGIIDRLPIKMGAPPPPEGSFDEGGFVPEPVKLSRESSKAKVSKPKADKKKSDQEKSKEKTDQKKADNSKGKSDKTNETSSGLEISSVDGLGSEGIYRDGPLGDYYLGYDFNYLKTRISANWSNPIKSNTEISCVIYFQITKDGGIQGVVVEKPSGFPIFDRYAEQAVSETKRLPALPQSFPDNEVLTIHLTFRHKP